MTNLGQYALDRMAAFRVGLDSELSIQNSSTARQNLGNGRAGILPACSRDNRTTKG